MTYRTATELIAALRAREVSSRELALATIARIEALDGPINAVVVRDFDRALAAADQADAALARGEARPLLGLPMTVKEAIDVEGLPTTWGVPGTGSEPAAEDAVVVARLKAAGAVVLGKTNVPVMLGDWQSANPIHGATSNPWDLARTAGGSSGGSAAAVAAGYVALEFGSDLGGSLRIPAAFCGVYAHKPSHQITPQRGSAPPGVPRDPIGQRIDLVVLGPLARSPADLALTLDVTAGPDEREAVAWRLVLPPPRHQSLKDFGVLVLDEHPLTPTAGSIRVAHGDLAARLEATGCGVARSSPLLPDLTETARLFSQLLGAMLSIGSPGSGPTLGAWYEVDRLRLRLAHQWRLLFEAFDVVLCPVSPTVAFAHDHREMNARELMVDGAAIPYAQQGLWISPASLTGLPVTAAPIGYDEDGLPIGTQVIGPYLEDRTPLAFAGLMEQVFGGFRAPPGF